jgi:hypothetical protein
VRSWIESGAQYNGFARQGPLTDISLVLPVLVAAGRAPCEADYLVFRMTADIALCATVLLAENDDPTAGSFLRLLDRIGSQSEGILILTPQFPGGQVVDQLLRSVGLKHVYAQAHQVPPMLVRIENTDVVAVSGAQAFPHGIDPAARVLSGRSFTRA